ncbi:MAG: hypothetical protein HUJ95_05075 [Bacteroidales bacterium]|nr:hypothetical protein [Bacteroidales bacterium]
MKKLFTFAVVAALAASILSGCAKQEPSEIRSVNMPKKAILYGFAQSRTYVIKDGSGTLSDATAIETEVTIHVTKIGSKAVDEVYTVATNSAGFFKFELGAPAEQSVSGNAYIKIIGGTSAVKDGTKWVAGGIADFYGTASFSIQADKSQKIKIIATPVTAYTSPDSSF